MWGIVPAAGKGSRIQPLAFSKELLPVGARCDEGEARRPRAVSDYLMERLALGGAKRICMVISSGKSDIMEYYGGSAWAASICYTVQPKPGGLCDAIFRALPFIDSDEPVLVGLPDTIWFPSNALQLLPDDKLSFLLFPVAEPRFFDSVECDEEDCVTGIRVKQTNARSNWIWGAFKMPGSTLHELYDLWVERDRSDEYIGTLVNAWIARGRRALAVRAGETYFDVGTMDGYLAAIRILDAGVQPAA